ncbi:AcrR family transcriptional regulator [Thermocatellispora tengchongensis]|uniref:AcrR family transcriptional regulator n=1 Tax=Thermocatellispora tengchongensis TaxID=1073253 RepID=A0A840PE87_9ACTN|nr:TetR/AcrR family transcriptional regulator [Thermocatellispora tengchongensis]MBB5137492.1 AcrR family transcriptional regulator [Thermocatellispora tengchongensis]
MSSSEETARPVSRLDRRKARTRAALIAAAQRLLAEQGGTEASIQQITDAADVGFGSFYNHFTSKAELFDAAISQALSDHAELLRRATAHLDDPAEVFAASVRLTARLRDTHPRVSKIFLHTGLPYLTAGHGMPVHALRDLRAADAAGRLDIGDPELAVACVGGALLGALQLLDARPGLDPDAAIEQVTVNLLRMFGLDASEARRLATRPLPGLP